MASPGSVVIQFLVDAKKAAKDAADLAKNFGKVDDAADDLDSTLDGLDKELDSIGRASKDLGDDMKKAGVGFDGVGDEAEDAADRVRRAAQDMARGVHDGGDKIDVETDGIRGSMKETGKEAGAELIGSIAEGVGSGTASLKDTVSGTLGGITNLAASIGGPVGLAAGAAAAGVGLVFAKVTAEAEAADARLQGMMDLLKDIGDVASETAKAAIFKDWVDRMSEIPGKVSSISDVLRTAGINQGTFRDAITGSSKAQEEVRKKLFLTAQEIIRAQKAHKPLTEEQKRFLDNQALITQEIGDTTDSIAKTKKQQSDVEFLTGETAKSAKDWATEQRNVYNETHKVKKELDGINDKDVNLTVHVRSTGSKIPNSGGGSIKPIDLAAGPTAMTTTATQAAPIVLPPVNVSVNLDQWGSARVTKRALEANDRRQGRPVGAPLRVAW